MQNRRDEEIKLKETLKEQSEMYNEMLQSQSAGVISYNTKTKKIDQDTDKYYATKKRSRIGI